MLFGSSKKRSETNYFDVVKMAVLVRSREIFEARLRMLAQSQTAPTAKPARRPAGVTKRRPQKPLVAWRSGGSQVAALADEQREHAGKKSLLLGLWAG